jgi:pyruvate ferredoxin oxidoreductase beta subunit
MSTRLDPGAVRTGAAPLPLVDAEDFRQRIVPAYNRGTASEELPADLGTARSLMPAATGALRDFSYIAPDIPLFKPDQCVGCMECVAACPDNAILAKVVAPETLDGELAAEQDGATRGDLRAQWTQTRKYWDTLEKKGEQGGLFGIFIDPSKCKGCAECVEVCGVHDALLMEPKEDGVLEKHQRRFQHFATVPDTPESFINERALADMMLAEKSLLYVGGAGSCMGCGEATAIRMMLAATGFVHGRDNCGIVASTGCNTVYGSTYPYNPYDISWTNSLFENGPADAMGVRARWDQLGWQEKRLWVLGGDGAMLDIGFSSLSRMLASGMDIKVLVLDTQVYSNTGGQASTASYVGQESKFNSVGKLHKGKKESRKEIGLIAMMHPDVYVAQTVTSDPNHFYRAILEANEYPGPAVISVYTTCQPEHGVGDDVAQAQAQLAKETRTFPVFTYDPRRGDTIRERLSLAGNPDVKKDWQVDRKTGEVSDFITFARTEGRFAKQFDAEGNPSEVLLGARDERLGYWRILQGLAGIEVEREAVT